MTEEISPELRQELGLEAAKNSHVFQLIGEFLFNFSQLEFSIRTHLSFAIGLTDEQFDAVTSTYDFANLCTVTEIIISKKFPDREKEIGKFFNQCRKLNTERVRVAHGLWTQGPNGPMCRHVSRNTLNFTYHYEDPKKLVALAEEARLLMRSVLFLPDQPSEAESMVVGEQRG